MFREAIPTGAVTPFPQKGPNYGPRIWRKFQRQNLC